MVANLSSSRGLSQTKKSSEMARAFSPANNNRQNMQEDLTITPEKSGVVKGEESRQTQETVTGMPSPAQQNRGVQTAAGIPEVQKMLGNLGIFNLNLNAGVNSFVNSAPAANANATLTAGGTPVFNQATGQWELPQDAQVAGQTGSLVSEKVGQQAALQAMAGDMFDATGKPKTFEQVLKKFGDANGNGVIDPSEQMWLNEAFGIVNSIRRLKNEDPYSAQAQALRQQLSQLDRNGMVSGLVEALDQYESIVNKKVAGADAESYYLADLLTMGEDEITQEVQKALTQSSGLFGADYETYLERELDKSAQEYQKAAQEDATVMQTIKEVADAWLKSYEGEFSKAKDTLNTMFKGTSDKLIADLSESAKTNKGVNQAMEWFVDTQTLVNIGSKDFGDVVFQALVDSPLGSESKKILKHWLGQTIGQDTVEKGMLAGLLDKLATTGYFWTEDANGTVTQVYLNGQQKMDIVRIINSGDMSDQQKLEGIQKYVESMSKGMSGRLEQDLGTVVGPIKSGQLGTALTNFRTAMRSSMEGFEGSLVQEGYTQTVDAMGRQSDPKAMQASIEQKAQGYLDGLTKSLTGIDTEIAELEKRITGDKSALAANKIQATDLARTGVSSVQTNYKNALKDYMTRATTPSADTTVNGKAASRLEAMWYQVSKNPPPANMNEIYSPILAVQGMVRNMQGTSDESLKTAYSILLRDYLGGDEAKLNIALNGSPFHADAIETGRIIYKAFQSPEFATQVFNATKNGQALAQRIAENDKAIGEAQAKLNEARSARSNMAAEYERAVKQLNMTTAEAKKAAATQAAKQPVLKLDQAQPQTVNFNQQGSPQSIQQLSQILGNYSADKGTVVSAVNDALDYVQKVYPKNYGDIKKYADTLVKNMDAVRWEPTTPASVAGALIQTLKDYYGITLPTTPQPQTMNFNQQRSTIPARQISNADYYIPDAQMKQGEMRDTDGSLYTVDDKGTKWLAGWSGNARQDHINQFGFDPFDTRIGGVIDDNRMLDLLENQNAQPNDVKMAVDDMVKQAKFIDPQKGADLENYANSWWIYYQKSAGNDMYSPQYHMDNARRFGLSVQNKLYDLGLGSASGSAIKTTNMPEKSFGQNEDVIGETVRYLRNRPNQMAMGFNNSQGTIGGSSQHMAPLKADISGETANNMFNQAIQGQTMPFTNKPTLDAEALKKQSRISFTERGKGLSPEGYGQYVNPEWIADGSKIAVSRPIADVGKEKVEQKPAAPAPAPAPVIRESQSRINQIKKEIKEDPQLTVGIDPRTGALTVVPKGHPTSVGAGYATSVLMGGVTDSKGNIIPVDNTGKPLAPTVPYRPVGQSPTEGGQPAPQTLSTATTSQEADVLRSEAEKQVAQAEADLKKVVDEKDQAKKTSTLTPNRVIDIQYIAKISEAEKAVEQAKADLAKVAEKERVLQSAEYAAKQKPAPQKPSTTDDSDQRRETPTPKPTPSRSGGMYQPRQSTRQT